MAATSSRAPPAAIVPPLQLFLAPRPSPAPIGCLLFSRPSSAQPFGARGWVGLAARGGASAPIGSEESGDVAEEAGLGLN